MWGALLAGSQMRAPAREPARTPTRPPLTPGALRATVRDAAPTPVRPSARREAQCLGPEPSRAPGALSPAGTMSPAHVLPAPSNTTATLALKPARKVTRYGQSGQQMTVLSAEQKKSGEGVWEGFGEERGKAAVVSRRKKTNRPASLPLLSLYCLSQEINLTTASPHQACFCLCDLDHR